MRRPGRGGTDNAGKHPLKKLEREPRSAPLFQRLYLPWAAGAGVCEASVVLFSSTTVVFVPWVVVVVVVASCSGMGAIAKKLAVCYSPFGRTSTRFTETRGAIVNETDCVVRLVRLLSFFIVREQEERRTQATMVKNAAVFICHYLTSA